MAGERNTADLDQRFAQAIAAAEADGNMEASASLRAQQMAMHGQNAVVAPNLQRQDPQKLTQAYYAAVQEGNQPAATSLFRQLQAQGDRLAPMSQQQMEAADAAHATQTYQSMPWADRMWTAMGGGFENIGKGAAQLGLKAANAIGAGTPTTENWQRELQQNIDEHAPYEQGVRSDLTGQLAFGAGQTLPLLPVGMMLPAAAPGAGVLSRLGYMGLQGGTQGALTGLMSSQHTGENKGAQVVQGGLGGLLTSPLGFVPGILAKGASKALQPLTEQLGGLVAKGAQRAGFGGLADALGNTTQRTYAPEYTQALQTANAGQTPVPLSMGDIAGPKSASAMLENASKFIPGSGRRDFMQQQAEALRANAKGLLSQTQAPIAEQLGSVEPETLAAQSIQNQYNLGKDFVKQLYGKIGNAQLPAAPIAESARDMLSEYPTLLQDAGMPMSQQKAIQALAARAPQAGFTDADHAAAANFFRGDNPAAQLASNPQLATALEKSGVVAPGFMDRAAGKATWDAGTIPLNDLVNLRSNMLTASRTLAANPTTQNAARQAGNAASLVDQHIENSVEGGYLSKETADALRQAQLAYKGQVVPYMNDPTLWKLTQGDTGEGLFGKLGPDRFATARQLMQASGPEGQQALQAGLMDRLLAKGVNETTQSGLNTTGLLRGLDLSRNRAAQEIFTPEQQAAMQSLSDQGKLFNRAGSYANDPDTGAQLSKLWSITKPAALLANPMNKLFQSPAFQRLYYSRANPVMQEAPRVGGLLGAGEGASLLNPAYSAVDMAPINSAAASVSPSNATAAALLAAGHQEPQQGEDEEDAEDGQ